MSRKEATLKTMQQMTTAMMDNEFNEGAICLLPILIEIALSLAVIADRMEGQKEGDGNETD